MAKYKVIAASVGGSKNRIFEFGDTVTDESFPVGNAPLLVEQGFLEVIEPAADLANLTPDQLLKIQENSHTDAIDAGDVLDTETDGDAAETKDEESNEPEVDESAAEESKEEETQDSKEEEPEEAKNTESKPKGGGKKGNK